MQKRKKIMKNKNISYVNTYTVKEQKIQKKDKIFLLVLYHPSQKYKIIKRCCIFYFENQSKMSKEVVHLEKGRSRNYWRVLPYFLAAFVHYMTLKTLQPGHWEVKEFFYAKLGTFRDLQRAPWSWTPSGSSGWEK